MTEFEIYIRNKQEFVPNFAERDRQGETIPTAFVESTINQWSADAWLRSSNSPERYAAHIRFCKREPRC